MGGLTVLSALREVLPGEHYLYLGDTARLPYGTKSPATVRRYAAQAAAQLVSRGVKALVVACNTASAFALDHLQREFAPLPVFGVVHPGAAAAVQTADASGVLVLATESTIAGGAYQRALAALSPRLKVYGRACPLWVTLAEQGPQHPDFVSKVLLHSLRGFQQRGPQTMLLGCTHFPVFKPLLENLLPDTKVVDSAATTAQAVQLEMREQGLLRTGARGEVCFLATDGQARFRQVGRHFLGEPIDEVELVDL
jgi:glutamate racemase